MDDILEGDPFAEFESDSVPVRSSFDTPLDVWLNVADVIRILLCIVSLGASIFLVYIILKFEKLKTKCNMFILHYAVVCIINLLVNLANGLVYFYFLLEYYYTIICVLFQIHIATCMMILIMGTAIGVYWFIENFRKAWIQKVHHFQIYFTVVVYVLCVLKLIVYSIECFVEHDWFFNYGQITLYSVTLIIIIYLNIFCWKRQMGPVELNTKYQLLISSCIILSYLPLFLYDICYHITTSYNITFLNHFIQYSFHFAQFLLVITPVVVVYLLGRMNKYFRTVYDKVFKKSLRNYEDGDTDDDTEEKEAVKDNLVKENTKQIFVA